MSNDDSGNKRSSFWAKLIAFRFALMSMLAFFLLCLSCTLGIMLIQTLPTTTQTKSVAKDNQSNDDDEDPILARMRKMNTEFSKK